MGRSSREGAKLTRERILDAAEKLFVARGGGALSSVKVAMAAGVTRGAVYWHFPDMQQLVLSIFERRYAPLLARLRASTDTSRHCAAGCRLTELCLELVAAVVTTPQSCQFFCLQLNYAIAGNGPGYSTRLREFITIVIDVFSVHFSASDALRFDSQFDVRERAHFVLNQILGSIQLLAISHDFELARGQAKANILRSIEVALDPSECNEGATCRIKRKLFNGDTA